MMALKNNDQAVDKNVARKILEPVGDLTSSCSRQENVNNDGAELKIRQTAEDLKERLKELLISRFLT
jgi:hypothetical protein